MRFPQAFLFMPGGSFLNASKYASILLAGSSPSSLATVCISIFIVLWLHSLMIYPLKSLVFSRRYLRISIALAFKTDKRLKFTIK